MSTFRPGQDRVLYAKAVYDEEEIAEVTKALRQGWLGHGKYIKDFEEKVAKIFGKKFGLFVNSGTSANTLAMEIAGIPAGSEVITQACTFPATLSPIVQQGYKPVFIDSKIGTYNINIDKLEGAISDATKAIFISHAIGNVNDMKRIREICNQYSLVFIEDACDTIGCKFEGRPTGEFSDITTASFYAAHNITAGGGGGMLMVSDPTMIDEARMLTDWGRAIPTSEDKDINQRFSNQLTDKTDFDGKFTFIRKTYNFKGIEMQGAFGLVQLKKLPAFNAIRARNFNKLFTFFEKHTDLFYLPEVHPAAEVYMIAFPLTIRENAPFTRRDLMTYLEEHKIQTRTLFAGNILKHSAYVNIRHRVYGDLDKSDIIMKNGMLLGINHGLTEVMIDYVIETFEAFLKKET